MTTALPTATRRFSTDFPRFATETRRFTPDTWRDSHGFRRFPGANPAFSRRFTAGFTLIELLIALLLFAMLAAAATGMLTFAVDARAATTARLDNLAAITRLRALLTADLGQAAPRTWRDTTGTTQPAFITGGPDNGGIVLLRLVRRGWRNDAGTPRASLQRVEYRLAGGRLERLSAPMVDGSTDGPPALLVAGVTGLSLRFHDGDGWRDRWDPENLAALPAAVEITVTATGIPALRQAFLVGPGAPR